MMDLDVDSDQFDPIALINSVFPTEESLNTLLDTDADERRVDLLADFVSRRTEELTTLTLDVSQVRLSRPPQCVLFALIFSSYIGGVARKSRQWFCFQSAKTKWFDCLTVCVKSRKLPMSLKCSF